MTMPISSNKYTIMQKAYYDNEGVTGNMNRENHRGHNANPDYWEILVKDSEDPEFLSKVGLDFACGCGRNIINLINRFKRMDGVDISPELIKETDKNLKQLNFDDTKYKLYTCNGVSLDTIESNTYDFVMTTIALQHICVYDIRLSYFKEFFRVMRSGGILSFQMGFGNKKPGTVKYYENYYDATSTNSGCDVRVEDPNDIINDLKNIGFKNITYQIRNSWDDGHHEWIYLRAIKP